MWIYRGRSGRSTVQGWCRRRLDNWALPHRRVKVSDDPPWDYSGAHLLIAGPHHAQTLVVLPGRHANAAVMTDLLEQLATRYRVIAVDLPGEAGLGAGGRPNTDRLRDQGEWFDRLLVKLARDAPQGLTVLAHGYGAAVALAAQPAPHVNGLVLLSPYGFTRPAVPVRVAAALAGWRIAPTAAMSARLLASLTGPGFTPAPSLVDWLRLVGRHVAMSTTPPVHVELAHRWRWTPCTVAVGEHDPLLGDGRLVRPVWRALRTHVVTVPDAGALLPHERPEAVLSLLRLHAGLPQDVHHGHAGIGQGGRAGGETGWRPHPAEGRSIDGKGHSGPGRCGQLRPRRSAGRAPGDRPAGRPERSSRLLGRRPQRERRARPAA